MIATPNPTEVDLVIYHSPCTDGFGAALAAWRLLGNKAQYLGCQYGAPPTREEVRGKNVAIVDVSFSLSAMEDIKSEAKSMVVLDHHASAREVLKGSEGSNPFNAIFDMDQSGAGLAWQWFHPGTQTPLLIQYIQDRDLWKWELPYSRAVSAFLQINPFNFEGWSIILDQMETPEGLRQTWAEGEPICKYVAIEAERAAKRSKCGTLHYVQNGEPKTLQVRVRSENPSLISDVGNEMVKLGEEVALLWFFDYEHGVFRCSLRSDDTKANVWEVAQAFGGGGHRNAAGFSWSSDIRELVKF